MAPHHSCEIALCCASARVPPFSPRQFVAMDGRAVRLFREPRALRTCCWAAHAAAWRVAHKMGLTRQPARAMEAGRGIRWGAFGPIRMGQRWSVGSIWVGFATAHTERVRMIVLRCVIIILPPLLRPGKSALTASQTAVVQRAVGGTTSVGLALGGWRRWP